MLWLGIDTAKEKRLQLCFKSKLLPLLTSTMRLLICLDECGYKAIAKPMSQELKKWDSAFVVQ